MSPVMGWTWAGGGGSPPALEGTASSAVVFIIARVIYSIHCLFISCIRCRVVLLAVVLFSNVDTIRMFVMFGLTICFTH